jgi:hypothetical protein
MIKRLPVSFLVSKVHKAMLAFLLAFFVGAPSIFAGNDGLASGPRSLGAGQISSLWIDGWAASNNPGALGWLRRSSMVSGYENRYGSAAFSQLGFSAALPTAQIGTFGFSANRFGSEVFNQTRASAAWGKAFGIASIGFQGQFYQVSAAELPSKSYFLLSFGGMARLTPTIRFAASISNLTQTKASDYVDETLPTIVRAGIGYQPVKPVLLMVEVQKDLDQQTLVKGALEYEFVKNFWLRTGFTTLQQVASGGFSFRWRELKLDYGLAHHPQMGWSHAIGIEFFFGKDHSQKSAKETDPDK